MVTVAEMATGIANHLTGGGQVELDITQTEIERLIGEAIDDVRPWVAFPTIVQTFNTIPSTDSCYVLKSSFSATMSFIKKVYPVDGSSGGGAPIVEFMGVPGFMVVQASGGGSMYGQATATMEYSQWMATKRQMLMMYNRMPTHKVVGDSVLISPNLSRVTIEYYPDFTVLDEMSEDSEGILIINHIEDRARAFAKRAIGLIRRKMTGSPLNFDMDGEQMVSEAQTELERLDEKLESLTLNLEPE